MLPFQPCICQGGLERRREPREIENCQAEEHRSDQDPFTISVVKGDESVGCGADPRLIAVNEVSEDEAGDRLDTTCAPKSFPNRRSRVHGG